MGQILDEYCEGIESIPTEKVKEFFSYWNGKIPGKLISQAIFAGIHWAITHPEDVIVEEVSK